MGLTITLETEDGNIIKSVGDTRNLLLKVLPNPEDTRFRFTNTIMAYNDTIFNQVQARLMMREWNIMLEDVQDEDTITILKEIKELFQDCISEEHLYVKFYGD